MSWFFGPLRASRKSDGTPLLSGTACAISIVAGIVSLSGCGDRTRTTSQSVMITVQDGQGLPVPNALLRIKESWESWKPPFITDADRSYRERWERFTWSEGSTNPQGTADVKQVDVELDPSNGGKPPARPDNISNFEYIIQVQLQDVKDELKVMMKPGAVGKGKKFTVRIESIQKPIYCDM